MKDLNIVRSNALIEASFNLTLNEYRVVVYAISCIKNTGKFDAYTEFTLSVNDFSQIFAINRKPAFKELKKVAGSLMKKELKIYKYPDGKPRDESEPLHTTWVGSSIYSAKRQEVIITLQAQIIPYLSDLSGFYTINTLKSIIKLSSVYSARIHDLCMQYISISRRQISVADLKQRLLITEKYKASDNFKRKVLDPSVEDITKNSEIDVWYKPVKSGRTIVAYEFEFARKPELKKKTNRITKSLIRKEAYPGESYEEAKARLQKKQNK
jgi:plasmid replication initiation protein